MWLLIGSYIPYPSNNTKSCGQWGYVEESREFLALQAVPACGDWEDKLGARPLSLE